MSYGAAFGLSAAMEHDVQWRARQPRVITRARSGGSKRLTPEQERQRAAEAKAKRLKHASMQHHLKTLDARMRGLPEPTPSDPELREQWMQDRKERRDQQRHESGLADAKQKRELSANAEQRAQQAHEGGLTDARRRRRREDVNDAYSFLDKEQAARLRRYEMEIADIAQPTRVKVAEADRDRLLTQAQTGLHQEAFRVFELRGPEAFAKTLNAMSTNGINDAASAVWEDGPKGRRLRVVDKQGGTVLDESGAPVIFSEAAIQKLTGTAGNWSIKDGYAIEKGSGQVRELDPGAGYRTAFLRTAQESAGNGYGQKPEDVVATARAVADAAYGRAPAQNGPPRVTSQADYAALPSGTQFIDPEGNLRVKP